jgi:two-component system cell cycle sensor histidine kinase PleC
MSAIRFGTGGSEIDSYMMFSLVPFSALILFLCRMEHLKLRDSLEVSFRSERLAHELVRARDEALRQRYDAQAASQAKSAFLANMSHELRTPLNAVIGFSDMIRSEYLGPVGSQRYIDYARDIHDSGQHLLALINDILDISKIEAGRLEIDPALVDAQEMIDSVVRLTRVRALEKGHALETEVEAGCPKVFADARALKQILVNLIGNSIKFTPDRGKITVVARRAGSDVEFTVTDTGRGIPEEHLARIFEPFEQIDNRYDRMEGGTGLGLALVKGLVELHKGHFDIESEVGVGTTVRVRLPTSPAKLAAA